jgi:hypothetical protein
LDNLHIKQSGGGISEIVIERFVDVVVPDLTRSVYREELFLLANTGLLVSSCYIYFYPRCYIQTAKTFSLLLKIKKGNTLFDVTLYNCTLYQRL